MGLKSPQSSTPSATRTRLYSILRALESSPLLGTSLFFYFTFQHISDLFCQQSFGTSSAHRHAPSICDGGDNKIHFYIDDMSSVLMKRKTLICVLWPERKLRKICLIQLRFMTWTVSLKTILPRDYTSNKPPFPNVLPKSSVRASGFS